MEKLTPYRRDISGYEVSPYSSGPKFRNGDTLVAKITPCLENGKTALVNLLESDEVAFGSSEFIVLRAISGQEKEEDNTDPMFLYYLSVSPNFRKRAISCMEGTSGRKRVVEGTLKNHTLLVPDYNEQRQIAAVLSTIDDKIRLNTTINHNLEAMAKQLYDYWFVQFDFPNEEGKPYKSSGGKMVWNGKLNREMPEGWGVEKIKDIANTYSGGTPKSTEMEYYENGNIPWINSGELNKPIITNTSNFITQSGLDNSSAKLYPSNAILIALYGATAGKVSLLSFEACSNQAICGIILNDSVMLDYTRLYLSSLYEHFITLSTGSARDNISQDTVKNTNVIMPQKEVLVSFNQIIRKTTEMLVKNLVEITSLTKQRDELLPLLMNGQVSVNYDLSHIRNRDRKHFYLALYLFYTFH